MTDAEHRDNAAASRAPTAAPRDERDAIDGAEAAADSIKSSVAGRVRHVADAARSAQDVLKGDEDWLAKALGGVGRQLEEISDVVATRDLGSLKDQAERLARDRPALFLGAAVALGFGVGRMLRATPPGAVERFDGQARADGQAQADAAASATPRIPS